MLHIKPLNEQPMSATVVSEEVGAGRASLPREEDRAAAGRPTFITISLIAQRLTLPGFQVCAGDQALEALDESLFPLSPRIAVAMTIKQAGCIAKNERISLH